MRIHLTSISASGLTLTTLSGFALAQTVAPAPPVPPPPPAASAAVYDPQQFPEIRGELERWTLTGRGDVDGFILKDGTEVKTAPNLSTQIAYAVKPGDRVTVHGLRAAALPLVHAVSVTDENSHRTVTDAGVSQAAPPSPRPAPPTRDLPPQASQTNSELSGRVRMALHGPQGEVNGVLLDSGAILRFSPEQADQLASLIQPRQSLVAQGFIVTNSLGTVEEVQQMGPSRDRLVAVGPVPRPMNDRGLVAPGRGPRPDAGPRVAPPPPPAGTAPSPGAPQPPVG